MQFNYYTRQHEIHITQIFVAKGLVPNRAPHIVIPTQMFAQSRNPVHTFNPEFPSHLSLESRIPAFTEGICLKDKANPGSRKTRGFGDPYMSLVDRPALLSQVCFRLFFHCVYIHCLYGLFWNL